jgi:hypothetical protein
MIKRIVFIVLIIGALFYGAHYFYFANDPTGKLKDTCQIVTGALTVIALSYAFLTYEFNYKKALTDSKKNKELLTFNTASEWSKPYMLKYQIALGNFEEKYDSNSEGYTKKFYDDLMKDENVREAFACIFNYLETVALAVSQDLVDKEYIIRFMYLIFESYYNTYKEHIVYRCQIRKVDKIWENYTDLAKDWINKKDHFKKKKYI